MLSGPPCSGKSSVGRILAAEPPTSPRRQIYIEVDSLFTLMLPRSDRSRDDRMLAYDAAHLLTRMLLGRGENVVLECTYARREQRASLVKALADLPSAPLQVVELFISPDDAVQRFRLRDQATDLDEQSVRERAEAFPYFDDAYRLTSSTAPPDHLARALSSWWRHSSPPLDRDAWADAGRAWA